MSLIPARCPQCGGTIKVDDSLESGVCEFCNTPFITEKIINNYNINIQNAVINLPNVQLENLKKLGDEKIKTFHYPFEMDEYEKAEEYFLKVLEFDDNAEYKLKTDLCHIANHTERISFADTLLIIDNVFNFIKEDEESEHYDEKRVSVYADLIRLMTDVINAVSGYYYERFSTSSLNASIYASINIDLAKKKVDFASYFSKYKESEKIVDVIISLCKTCQSDLSSSLPIYVPGLSEDIYEKIPIVAQEVKKIGLTFDSSFEVREDICNISMSNTNNSSNMNNNSKGCYIATAVYGSYDCPQVWTLRRFRDFKLAKTWYGRVFIKFYYAISPTVVKWFGDYRIFNSFWRFNLDKLINNLQAKGYANSPYLDNEKE